MLITNELVFKEIKFALTKFSDKIKSIALLFCRNKFRLFREIKKKIKIDIIIYKERKKNPKFRGNFNSNGVCLI